MGGTAYSAQQYVSKFTLAIMEDSAWYKVDYNYAEPYTWGQQAGCTFINDDCIDTSSSVSNFPQYWCDEDNDGQGCTADYSGKATCYNIFSATNIPSEFKYYTDNSAGPSATDYCAFKYVEYYTLLHRHSLLLIFFFVCFV